MELIKKNIHMDCVKSQAMTQFTLEDDLNIPDSKPDVNILNLEKGIIQIDEVRPITDFVIVKGCLQYAILYYSMEENGRLVLLTGNLAFEEKIHLQGAASTDQVRVEGKLDDLTVGMINSRKLSVKSLIALSASIIQLVDVEMPIGVQGGEKIEYRKQEMDVTKLTAYKNDVLRIREDLTIPGNYPNIGQILWDSISLGDVEFRVLDGRIDATGDIHIFVLYEAEDENHSVRNFETTVSFNKSMEDSGCYEGMIPDIQYRIGQKELAIRPDLDGEERCIGLEISMDINIRIYEEEKLEVVTDLYGLTKSVDTISQKESLKSLIGKIAGKAKVTGRVHVNEGKVLQLVHSECILNQDSMSVEEHQILLQGSLGIKVMYVTGEDEKPYNSVPAQLPFEYRMEIPNVMDTDEIHINGEVEQIQITMSDGEELDVKAVLCFSVVAFRFQNMELLQRITVSDLNTGEIAKLPGIVIYMAKQGDNLCNIGKKYYCSVDSIRKINHLEKDQLEIGQKLLIVKQS